MSGKRGERHYGCTGLRAGPANLSPDSLLHGGQQLPATTLQALMLNNLVSLEDLTNKFSFLAYLHAHRKMHHFINTQFDAIPRQEFRNYPNTGDGAGPARQAR